jgi:hypothetical protein
LYGGPTCSCVYVVAWDFVYSLSVLGKVCVGQLLRQGFRQGGSQKRVRAMARAAWVVFVGVA